MVSFLFFFFLNKSIHCYSNFFFSTAKGNVTYKELEAEVFAPNGFYIKKFDVPIPTLKKIKEQECSKVLLKINNQ